MSQKSSYSQYPDGMAKNVNQNDPKNHPVVGAIIQLLIWAVSAGAIPVRLLLRENIGERSISPYLFGACILGHTYYAYAYIAFTVGGGLFLGKSSDEFESLNILTLSLIALFFNTYNYYLIEVFVVKGLSHFKSVAHRAKNKLVINLSTYRGDSRYPWYFQKFIGKHFKTPIGTFIIDEDLLRMLVEPWIIGKFGLKVVFYGIVFGLFLEFLPFYSWLLNFMIVLMYSFSISGIFIALSALCLFFDEFILFSKYRNYALDMIDGEADLQKVLSEKNKMNVIKGSIEPNEDEDDIDVVTPAKPS